MKNSVWKSTISVLFAVTAFGADKPTSCPQEFSAVTNRASQHRKDFCGNRSFDASDNKLKDGLSACADLETNESIKLTIKVAEQSVLKNIAELCRTYLASNDALIEACKLKAEQVDPVPSNFGAKPEYDARGKLIEARDTKVLLAKGVLRARKIGAELHDGSDKKAAPLALTISNPDRRALPALPEDEVDASKVKNKIVSTRKLIGDIKRLSGAIVTNRSKLERGVPKDQLPKFYENLAKCWKTRDVADHYLTIAEGNLFKPLQEWNGNLKKAEDMFRDQAKSQQTAIDKSTKAIIDRCSANDIRNPECTAPKGKPVAVLPDSPGPPPVQDPDSRPTVNGANISEPKFQVGKSSLVFSERPVDSSKGVAQLPPEGIKPPDLPDGAIYRPESPSYWDKGTTHTAIKTWSIVGPKTSWLGQPQSYGKVNVYKDKEGKIYWTVTWY